MKITEKEINAITGEETITERDATAEELKLFSASNIKIANELAEAEAKVIARQEILDRLGLTADEAAILLG
jgi:hypothetical protein